MSRIRSWPGVANFFRKLQARRVPQPVLLNHFLKLTAEHIHPAIAISVATGSGDHDSSIGARFHRTNFRLNHGGCCADAAKIIRREFQYSHRGSEKILLITNILIGRDDEIELLCGQR